MKLGGSLPSSACRELDYIRLELNSWKRERISQNAARSLPSYYFITRNRFLYFIFLHTNECISNLDDDYSSFPYQKDETIVASSIGIRYFLDHSSI